MSERLTTNVLDALDERAASGELADMLVPKATVRALVAEVRASRSVAAGDGEDCTCYDGCDDEPGLHQHADDPCAVHPDRPFVPDVAARLRHPDAKGSE
jgi:hypothetical protein